MALGESQQRGSQPDLADHKVTIAPLDPPEAPVPLWSARSEVSMGKKHCISALAYTSVICDEQLQGRWIPDSGLVKMKRNNVIPMIDALTWTKVYSIMRLQMIFRVLKAV